MLERCPACGDRIDFCSGHGELGDPVGHRVLIAHDKGRHHACSPMGCDEAFDVSVDDLMADPRMVLA